MTYQSVSDWSVEEFGRAKLDDVRWRERLIQMATRAARHPNGRVTEVFTDEAQRQGAYGLLESRSVTPEQVGAAMFLASAQRCASDRFVFVPVDGSSLNITDSDGSKGFGSVGARDMGARGLKVISALAVSEQGVTLGLLSQVWWNRTGPKATRDHDRRPTSEKETRHWLTAMAQTREAMREHARDTRCWFQLDREGDAWPILYQAGDQDHWFTVRGSHNRRVTQPDGRTTYLRSVVEAQSVSCKYQLPIVAGPNRTARTALMTVRAATVTLDFNDKRSDRNFAQILNVVLACEQSPPPGQKPIEWLLLTNHPVETTEDLAQIIFGYSQRWRIEDFHRTWKSGACNVERMQLRSVSASIKWATLLAAVATRIERIKLLSRTQPHLPATTEFTPVELRAILLLRFGRKPPPAGHPLTLAQATLWLAQIGGYTGKSSGGPPGSVILTRAMRDVQAAVRTLEALDQNL
jgi:hypothetical protein